MVNQTKILCLACVLSVFGLAIVPDPAHALTVVHDMSVTPESASPAWSFNGSTTIRSLSSGVLRINDAGSNFLQYGKALSNPGKTLEARVRIDSSTVDANGLAAYMGLNTGGPSGMFLALETDQLSLVERTGGFANEGTFAADLSDDFRVIRFTQDAITTRVYLDGIEVLSHNQAAVATSVNFGAATIPSTSDASWDYVAYTDSGAFAPSEFLFFAVVPEPSTLGLLALGTLGLMAAARRRK